MKTKRPPNPCLIDDTRTSHRAKRPRPRVLPISGLESVSEPHLGLLESHRGSLYRALLQATGTQFKRKAFDIFAASPAAIMVTDRQGVIEYVNEKFFDLTGFHADEVIGLEARIFKSSETPPECFTDLWNTLLTGREWHGEFRNRRKNGEIYWEFASIWPVNNEDGEIEHFLAIKTDITQRKAGAAEEEAQSTPESQSPQEMAAANSLNHFICICAWCTRVREQERIWTRLDRYLITHSQVEISHGICPDCMSDQLKRIAEA